MMCSCGLQKSHFKCLGCGMHNALDSVPCISCSYFRFEPVSVETAKPVPSPAATKQTKRRHRGAADSTQRE